MKDKRKKIKVNKGHTTPDARHREAGALHVTTLPLPDQSNTKKAQWRSGSKAQGRYGEEE
jgi:hypothetical protein